MRVIFEMFSKKTIILLIFIQAIFLLDAYFLFFKIIYSCHLLKVNVAQLPHAIAIKFY